jgi:cell wall-associated NlpC family hydrolase
MNVLIPVLLTALTAAKADGQTSPAEARIAQAIASFEPFPPRKRAKNHATILDKGRAARIARELVPDGDLPVDRANWFCALVLRLALTNPTLVFAQIEASPTAPGAPHGVRLIGAASAPCVAQALTSALHAVGIEHVSNEIRLLPDRTRLGNELFGACREFKALTRIAPQERAGVQTELLFGEPVYLLDRDGEYLLLQAGDGYWGWAHRSAIAPMTADQFSDYLWKTEFAALADIDTGGVRIPRGARVRFQCINADFAVLVPGGGFIAPGNQAAKLDEITNSVAAEHRIIAALDLLGTPYVFGGRSPAGLDCSGLLTNIAARCGEVVARDANQQALAGRLTATAWFRDSMRAGDQVFFIDPSGKIYHTGIAISPTHILHAAPPGVQIGTFVRGDRLYDERIDRDFFIAKRP